MMNIGCSWECVRSNVADIRHIANAKFFGVLCGMTSHSSSFIMTFDLPGYTQGKLSFDAKQHEYLRGFLNHQLPVASSLQKRLSPVE